MDDYFLLALTVTVLTETAVLFVSLYYFFAERRPPFSCTLFAGFFTSSWSLPYLWYLLPRYVPEDAMFLVGESVVILAEAFILRFVLNLSFRQSLGFSSLCNLASIMVGIAFFTTIG